jgi:sugar fermentation stimulation protein A
MDGLALAVRDGLEAWVIFFIPRTDAKVFSPNDETDPAFGEALRRAVKAGVKVMALRFGFDGMDMEYLGRVRLRL